MSCKGISYVYGADKVKRDINIFREIINTDLLYREIANKFGISYNIVENVGRSSFTKEQAWERYVRISRGQTSLSFHQKIQATKKFIEHSEKYLKTNKLNKTIDPRMIGKLKNKQAILDFYENEGRLPSKNNICKSPEEKKMCERMRSYCNPAHPMYDKKFSKLIKKRKPSKNVSIPTREVHSLRDALDILKGQNFKNLKDLKDKEERIYKDLKNSKDLGRFCLLMGIKSKANPWFKCVLTDKTYSSYKEAAEDKGISYMVLKLALRKEKFSNLKGIPLHFEIIERFKQKQAVI